MSNLHPVFAAVLRHLPEQVTGITRSAREQAAEARKQYEDQCAAAGSDVDPVLADITFQRALARAEGRIYFAGD